MSIVRGIYHYPIKGLSPQPLRGVELEAGKPLPFDRVFALVRPGAPVDAEAPRWAKKGLFLMLMLDETLARVQTRLDPETLRFSVHREVAPPAGSETRERAETKSGGEAQAGAGAKGECVLDVDLASSAGRAAVEAFFQQQVPKLNAAPRLVHAPAGHFMDKPDNVVSLINLATVRALEAEWGRSIHPLRFRANFYIDGAGPWEEFAWVGNEILLGDVLFRVDRRNGRCAATNVHPLTGERDLDIPGSLRNRFGHKDLGVYLVAQTSGRVVIGDDVRVPELKLPVPAGEPARIKPSRNGTFICRGCYFIYDEAQLTPAGAAIPFLQLGDAWRCPDCGTGTANFQPYLDVCLGVTPVSAGSDTLPSRRRPLGPGSEDRGSPESGTA